MTFDEFLEQYEFEGAIVLLEGKRDVLDQDKEKLFTLGKLLTSKTEKMIFRSGNAGGADQFFSDGITSVNSQRLQVITPYAGHRKKTNHAYETISLDSINISSEQEVIYQSKTNKKTNNIIDKYASGEKNRFTIKAAYIIRDTIKAIGTSQIKPATFGIFYDDLTQPKTGGTGHTMNICLQNNIPIIDQSTWFQWLD